MEYFQGAVFPRIDLQRVPCDAVFLMGVFYANKQLRVEPELQECERPVVLVAFPLIKSLEGDEVSLVAWTDYALDTAYKLRACGESRVYIWDF